MTYTLMAICVFVFILQSIPVLGGHVTQALWYAGGYSYPTGTSGVLNVSFQPWRLLTSVFAHSGIVHIGLNMFFVYAFGGLLEPALGRVRFALLYLAGIIGGSIGAMALSAPTVMTVGASGAAFSLLGAALVMARLRGHSELESNLLTIAALNFGFTFLASGISVGGHIGGFVVGMICGALAYGPFARRPQQLTIAYAVLCLALFAGALWVAGVRTPDSLPTVVYGFIR